MLRRGFCTAKNLRRAKEVRGLGVILDNSRDISISDARSLLFARFIGIEKSIPVTIFHVGQNGQISPQEETQIERNIKTIEKLEIPIEKMTVVGSDPRFGESVTEVLDGLKHKQLIKEGSNKRTTFQIPKETIKINDMKLGESEYDYKEQLGSQRFYIRKSESDYNPNFLFSVLQHTSQKEPIVIVENETNFTQSLYKSALLEALEHPHCRFLHIPPILTVDCSII